MGCCFVLQERDLWFFAFRHLLYLRDRGRLPPPIEGEAGAYRIVSV